MGRYGNTPEASKSADTGIDDDAETDNYPSVQIYPNPTKGQLVVSSEYRVESIEIFDVMGRKVQSFEFNVQSYELGVASTLRLDNLANGIYIMRITTENGEKKKKIVKQ
jgi:hypothetical protein